MHRRQASAALLFGLLFLASCNNTGEGPVDPGPKWTTYTQANSPLLSNSINAIITDGTGRMWIGTDEGASTYYKGSWGSFVDSLGYPDLGGTTTGHAVTALAEGIDGSIWFGLRGGAVKRYLSSGTATKTWYTYDVPNAPSSFITAIGSVHYKTPGDVWVGSTSGITRFVPSTVQPEFGVWSPSSTFSSSLPNNNIGAIAVNPLSNQAHFGTQNGLAIYDDENNIWSTYAIPAAYNSPIISIAFDLGNTIWMGKWSGVSTYNRVTSQHSDYTSDNTGGQLPLGMIHAVATDLHSTRWFGSDFGLARLKDTTWTMFTHATEPKLPSDTVYALAYDLAGKLWIGTSGGVAVYNAAGN